MPGPTTCNARGELHDRKFSAIKLNDRVLSLSSMNESFNSGISTSKIFKVEY